MPVMNGIELYGELKKRDHLIKLCFLTALSDSQEFDAFKNFFPDESKRSFAKANCK